MEKFDRKVFNTDPKHEEQRNNFDAMVEDAFNRIAARKAAEDAKNKPAEPETFFDAVAQMIFGKPKE